MIVRTTRVKVGHCQAPIPEKPGLDEVGLFLLSFRLLICLSSDRDAMRRQSARRQTKKARAQTRAFLLRAESENQLRLRLCILLIRLLPWREGLRQLSARFHAEQPVATGA